MTAQAKESLIKSAWAHCLAFLGIWFIFLLLFSIPLIIFSEVSGTDFSNLKLNSGYLLANQFSSVLAVLLAVYLMRKVVERKSVSFPWLKFDFKGFLQGALLAFFLIGISSAILSITGLVEFHYQSLSADLLTYLGLFILVALHEEILCRGYLLDTLNKAYGSLIGILISTLIFTGLHIFNNHIGWVGLSNIFLSGILMAFFFLRKNNLWAAIGIHFAWNYAQGPIFGFAVSGVEVGSLLEVEHFGSSFLTGSAFGLEGSVITLVVLATATLIVMAVHFRKRELPSEPRKEVAKLQL